MKVSGLLVVIFFILTGCYATKKDWKYAKGEISFTVPGDWKITDKDSLDGAGYYVSIEKDGLMSSGLYIVTWVNQKVDSLYYLEEIRKGFMGRKELQNVKFEAIRTTDYNGIPAISSDFSFSCLNEISIGRIYILTKSNKTYSITEQGARTNDSENQSGFQLIKSSFQIK